MPDLSATYDIRNPFGLVAADFRHDLDGYRAALGFLSDLAGGSDHDEALTTNGGSPAMLRGWQNSDKFRRVYAKCRAAGNAERSWAVEQQEAVRRAEGDAAATDDEAQGIPSPDEPGPEMAAYRLGDGLENLPRRAFSYQPNRGSWGG